MDDEFTEQEAIIVLLGSITVFGVVVFAIMILSYL